MGILNQYIDDRTKSDYKVNGITLNLSIIKNQSRESLPKYLFIHYDGRDQDESKISDYELLVIVTKKRQVIIIRNNTYLDYLTLEKIDIKSIAIDFLLFHKLEKQDESEEMMETESIPESDEMNNQPSENDCHLSRIQDQKQEIDHMLDIIEYISKNPQINSKNFIMNSSDVRFYVY